MFRCETQDFRTKMCKVLYGKARIQAGRLATRILTGLAWRLKALSASGPWAFPTPDLCSVNSDLSFWSQNKYHFPSSPLLCPPPADPYHDLPLIFLIVPCTFSYSLSQLSLCSCVIASLMSASCKLHEGGVHFCFVHCHILVSVRHLMFVE